LPTGSNETAIAANRQRGRSPTGRVEEPCQHPRSHRTGFIFSVEVIPTVKRADVELVFDPPWNQSMMSEAARLQTGMLWP